ncbi:MAG TPA: chemotaxis protein CheW [Fibrobacteria bacterium]|nr:chemotaxis protein CheW [Fibrobacteria bacterium]
MTLLLETRKPEIDAIVQFLTFRLGGENFGIPIERVREILQFVEPTLIPMMPPFLCGVINLRGAVVPVIDLQCRFGRETTNVAHRSCIVIVEIEYDGAAHSLGILVDAVDEVLAVERSRIEPKPTFGTKIRSDFVDGLLNLEKRFVVTLDIQQVLSIDELATLVGTTVERT